MKILFTISLVTLIYALHVSSVPSASHSVNRECCSKFSLFRVRPQQVVNVAYSNCSHKAIIVKTVCNKTICFNATMRWAKTLLQNFEKKLLPPLWGSPNCTMTAKKTA